MFVSTTAFCEWSVETITGPAGIPFYNRSGFAVHSDGRAAVAYNDGHVHCYWQDTNGDWNGGKIETLSFSGCFPYGASVAFDNQGGIGVIASYHGITVDPPYTGANCLLYSYKEPTSSTWSTRTVAFDYVLESGCGIGIFSSISWFELKFVEDIPVVAFINFTFDIDIDKNEWTHFTVGYSLYKDESWYVYTIETPQPDIPISAQIFGYPTYHSGYSDIDLAVDPNDSVMPLRILYPTGTWCVGEGCNPPAGTDCLVLVKADLDGNLVGPFTDNSDSVSERELEPLAKVTSSLGLGNFRNVSLALDKVHGYLPKLAFARTQHDGGGIWYTQHSETGWTSAQNTVSVTGGSVYRLGSLALLESRGIPAISVYLPEEEEHETICQVIIGPVWPTSQDDWEQPTPGYIYESWRPTMLSDPSEINTLKMAYKDRAHQHPHENGPIMMATREGIGGDGEIWYVDVDNVSGNEDGLSWATAFTTIQAGVNAAYASGGDDEVWIAEGAYSGAAGNVVTVTNGVYLYGGFSGTETARSERDWAKHVTAIDGEGERRGVYCEDVDSGTLDGFTIIQGHAADYGGGMYNVNSSPAVRNCKFTNNTAGADGGGMYNSGSSPQVTNCVFFENEDGRGSAHPPSPPGADCVFLNNLALFANICDIYNPPPHPSPPPHPIPPDRAGPTDHAGAPHHAGPPEAANCVMCHGAADLVSAHLAYFASADAIYNPHPTPHPDPPPASSCIVCHSITQEVSRNLLAAELDPGSGGGMYNENSSPILMNCTFANNVAGVAGGGIYNDASSSPTVTNCILWDDAPDEISGSATVTFSCVENGPSNDGNITDDPLFVDGTDPDPLRLTPGSPCIDTGTAAAAPATDILGIARPQGAGFDMGAYEHGAFMIIQQPKSQTVLESLPVSFTVIVSDGIGPISYQWRRDGMDLTNADQSTYTIPHAQVNHEGGYTCVVTDEYNNETMESDIATLTVLTGVPVSGVFALAVATLSVILLVVWRLRWRKE